MPDERNAPPEILAYVFYAGKAAALVRSPTHQFSRFGGPCGVSFESPALPSPLHHVATIGPDCLKQKLAFDGKRLIDIIPPGNYGIPLFYGFSYSGCDLRYALGLQGVELSSIDPKSADPDWPYRHYPTLLPYFPLEVAEVRKLSWKKFAGLAENLPDEQPAEIVVLVPPPATVGYSMWGPDGDGERVTLVFEIEPKIRSVHAYNVCT
ncbi:hypothetical protein GC170_20025 [bacterium]|nr:hypothetical protein [bacterium]